MTKANPYAFMIPLAQKFFAEEQRKEKQSRKARFTLITNSHEEKEAVDMSTQQPIASPNCTSKPEDGTYEELMKNLSFIQLGIDAITGIGELLYPEMGYADGELSAHRSDASAVFRFFGEALKPATNKVYNVADQMSVDARRGMQ